MFYLDGKKTPLCLLCLLAGILVPASASPWLEADDPYLRSDIQYLADAGLLLMPLNTYPIRWAALADQLAKLDTVSLSPTEYLAYRHVRYQLDSARLGRGRQHLTLHYRNDEQTMSSGFAGQPRGKYGLEAGIEIVEQDFAMRVNSTYQQAEDSDDHWAFTDSYVAFGLQDVALSVGWLNRWWGAGWRQALIWGQSAQALPSASLSYQPALLPVLGSTWLETVLAKQDGLAEADTLWANRFSSRPVSWLQVGASYLRWFGGSTELSSSLPPRLDTQYFANQEQWGMDVRFSTTLPGGGAGGIYSEYSQSLPESFIARLYGMDAQWLIGQTQLRLLLEHQLTPDASAATPLVWQHKTARINDIGPARYSSLGGYLQFPNDHQMAVFYIDEKKQDANKLNKWQLQYQLPLFKGRLTIDVNTQNQSSPDDNKTSLSVAYQYRFH